MHGSNAFFSPPAYLQSASESVYFLWVKNSTGNKLQNHLRLVARGIAKPDATVALPAVIWLDLFKKRGATTQGQCNKRGESYELLSASAVSSPL